MYHDAGKTAKVLGSFTHVCVQDGFLMNLFCWLEKYCTTQTINDSKDDDYYLGEIWPSQNVIYGLIDSTHRSMASRSTRWAIIFYFNIRRRCKLWPEWRLFEIVSVVRETCVLCVSRVIQQATSFWTEIHVWCLMRAYYQYCGQQQLSRDIVVFDTADGECRYRAENRMQIVMDFGSHESFMVRGLPLGIT